MTDRPILQANLAQLNEVTSALVGSRLVAVRYRPLSSIGIGDRWSGSAHEVDLDIELVTSSGALTIAWARDDMVEGLSMACAPTGDIDAEGDEPQSSVEGLPEWQALIGKTIIQLNFSWHESWQDSARSLWAARLDFEANQSAVVALGELVEESRPSYHPDSLVVLFDEGTSRQYYANSSSESAWG